MTETLKFRIDSASQGQRLDKVLAQYLADYSRSRLQSWINSGNVSVNGQNVASRYKVQSDDEISVDIPQPLVVTESAPENIGLDIIYTDQQLIVINKPAGLVVHPAAGNAHGTLQNALLHHFPDTRQLPRAGIVHRLDKETSGLLVIARTPEAHKSLVEQLQSRTVAREYDAIANGEIISGSTIDLPIGRHSVDRKRMAVREHGGKEAITHYRVHERFRVHTHIKVRLETGRTHQIRVHMAHVQKSLLGDPVYGGRLRLPKGADIATQQRIRQFKRQALHAARLCLIHPSTQKSVSWEAPLPDDMRALIECLRMDYQASQQR